MIMFYSAHFEVYNNNNNNNNNINNNNNNKVFGSIFSIFLLVSEYFPPAD